MPDISVLDVRLHGDRIGTLTLIPGDRTLFAFDKAYIENPERATLSLSFKDQFGELLTQVKPNNVRVPPFFSNLLPEGPLRSYLAKQAGVNKKREFFLLWILGRDLPGALTIVPPNSESWPELQERGEREERRSRRTNTMRFSLAGIQLKFSAIKNVGKGGGLTIPADGVGGSWIVKLPSQRYDGVPENEFSMMSLAARLGMDVPEIQLIDIDTIDGLPEGIGKLEGPAFAIRRFDRADTGPVHIEDFAQVFGVWPNDKYERASALNIVSVIGVEADDAGATEFIRRLVFNTLIGNADMHLKNWSLIYPDRRTAALAPAYDFVSTIPYIPDDLAALKYARTKRMREFSLDELRYLVAKARLPQKILIDTAVETVARFREEWSDAKKTLPIARPVAKAIDAHLKSLALISDIT